MDAVSIPRSAIIFAAAGDGVPEAYVSCPAVGFSFVEASAMAGVVDSSAPAAGALPSSMEQSSAPMSKVSPS